MPRPPLAKGDDGSGNRYPVRHLPEEMFSDKFCDTGHPSAHDRHILSGVAHADCRECVPAALIAETPERFDHPCEGDE